MTSGLEAKRPQRGCWWASGKRRRCGRIEEEFEGASGDRRWATAGAKLRESWVARPARYAVVVARKNSEEGERRRDQQRSRDLARLDGKRTAKAGSLVSRVRDWGGGGGGSGVVVVVVVDGGAS